MPRTTAQEFRISTPDEWRLRGIGGIFWEDYTIHENIDWMYKSLPACTDTVTSGCLTNIGPAPGAEVRNHNVRGDTTSFFDDITRGLHTEGGFRLGGFRHHSEGTHAHRGHALLPHQYHRGGEAPSAVSAA